MSKVLTATIVVSMVGFLTLDRLDRAIRRAVTSAWRIS